MVIAANQDTLFVRLCTIMGRPELAHDDASPIMLRVATSGRARRTDQRLGRAPRSHSLVERLTEVGVVAGPINTVEDVVKDPQLIERGMLVDHYDERDR